MACRERVRAQSCCQRERVKGHFLLASIRQNRALGLLPWVLLAGWAVAMAGGPYARGDDAPSGLAGNMAAIMAEPPFAHAHWGILVADLKDGTVLYEWNADKLFAPASVTKLFSVAAALDALGAEFRFETAVYRRGACAEGTLQGDLILVASGDPTLGGRTDEQGRIAFENTDHTYAGFASDARLTAPDPLAGLRALARQVAEGGIRRVTGEVLIDDRLFEQAEGTGSGPSRLTPIVVNDNVIDLLLSPTEPGAPATVQWRPQCGAWTIDAHVTTSEPGLAPHVTLASPVPGRLVVRGTVPAGRSPLLLIYEVPDPASFARALFIEALREVGVAVAASPLDSNRRELLPRPDEQDLERVALFTSPPFAEEAKLILKVSHNLHASMLPLILAARQGRRTLADGLRAQREFLGRAGVDVDTISFGGAAGGDRADYVTPRATVQLLRYMATRHDAPVYRQALPVLGLDGTLAGVVAADSPAAGKFFAKTGTLLWYNAMNDRPLLTSKALAGYGATSSGREVAFAAFVNNVHLTQPEDRLKVGQALGRVCEAIYQQ
jgi:D-alanyl-D-alanine carboxypeptidase/D-alanyl-D-alanine-endopeptidase (penicillin-binding protein 4)